MPKIAMFLTLILVALAARTEAGGGAAAPGSNNICQNSGFVPTDSGAGTATLTTARTMILMFSFEEPTDQSNTHSY